MIKSGTSLYDPAHITRASGIRSGHTVVDLMCGHLGHVTMPAATMSGDTGTVYAVDLRSSALDSLRGRLQLGHKGNIELVRGDAERVGGVPLQDSIADVVLLVDTLSITQNRLEVVKEAVRLLKSGGIFTVVDWHPYGDSLVGPVASSRLSEQEARSLCMVNGLKLEGSLDPGNRHYGFTFTKLVV
jgi:ubiquinone/menaquinone biosynthesis C-methylase UbiE